MIDLARIERLARRAHFRPGAGVATGWDGRRRRTTRGHGLSFAGHREYAYGDDIRHMDWRVTARLARPFVKLFEQHHAGSVMLLLDVSASMREVHHGTHAWQTLELAAFVIVLAMQAGERVGAMLFTDRVECAMAPRRGRAHALALVSRIEACRPAGTRTALAASLDAAGQLAPPGTSLVVVSDFPGRDYGAALERLRRRHDVTALSTAITGAPLAPDRGLVPVRDPESGATRWIDAGSARVRAALASGYRQLAAERQAQCESAAVPLIELGDEPSWISALARVGLRHDRAHG